MQNIQGVKIAVQLVAQLVEHAVRHNLVRTLLRLTGYAICKIRHSRWRINANQVDVCAETVMVN